MAKMLQTQPVPDCPAMPSSHPTNFSDASLTIVLPVLNEATKLGPSLLALQPLRARGARVVVADGGSTDGTLAVAQQHADLALVARRGRGAQMNAGAAAGFAPSPSGGRLGWGPAALKTGALPGSAAIHQKTPLPTSPAATEDILLFLHADTALPEHADRCIQQALQGGAVWGRFDVYIDSPRLVFRMIERLMNLRSRWSGVATGDQAVFVRRTAFESVGGFEDIALMEDIALSRALLRLSRPACLRQRVTTSARRWEQHGVWRTVLLMWRLRAAYFLGADPDRLALQYGYRPRGR